VIAAVLHQIPLCLFFFFSSWNLCQSQSQVHLGKPSGLEDLLQLTLVWQSCKQSTLSCAAEVKHHHNWISKPKQVNKEIMQRGLPHCTESGLQWQAVVGVRCIGSLCKTNSPEAGNTRPDPGTEASCHTFHTPTIKIPKRIRPQHYIQSSAPSLSPATLSPLHSPDSQPNHSQGCCSNTLLQEGAGKATAASPSWWRGAIYLK